MLGRAGRKDLLKKTIASAEIIALTIYTLFIIFVIGIMGNATTPSALVGLRNVLGINISQWLFLLSFIISFCSFLIMALTLKKVFAYDFKINKFLLGCLPYYLRQFCSPSDVIILFPYFL